MGLFGKSCPLEKSHLAIYGIQPTHKWTREDCLECEYQVNEKCNYNEINAQHENQIRRGKPATALRSRLTHPAAGQEKAEAEAVKKAGFTSEEENEYWAVSAEYVRLWNSAGKDKQQDILDNLDQWRVNLEKGDSPARAKDQANEWQTQQLAFKSRIRRLT
jgi:hypothetical protein